MEVVLDLDAEMAGYEQGYELDTEYLDTTLDLDLSTIIAIVELGVQRRAMRSFLKNLAGNLPRVEYEYRLSSSLSWSDFLARGQNGRKRYGKAQLWTTISI